MPGVGWTAVLGALSFRMCTWVVRSLRVGSLVAVNTWCGGRTSTITTCNTASTIRCVAVAGGCGCVGVESCGWSRVRVCGQL